MFSDKTQLKTATGASIKVISGDISRTESDALITAINSGGMWFGGIDGVIQRQAGNHFHAQAAANQPLIDGKAIIASGRDGVDARGTFKNVVFVVDDLAKPLNEIVRAGLAAASEAGFQKVTLPTIRMGVMLGAVEKTQDETVKKMAVGVKEFLAQNPNTPVKDITFVVFRDAGTVNALSGALRDTLKS